jgi:D-beta-D-heptose 7-phosphate kinase/D-beta-D-heptose 1-phosphate adenosyltransferase
MSDVQPQPKVLVTGVFDVLHQEHIAFLQKAKQRGYLVVAIETDVRVKKLKGEGRPINSQTVRLENLRKLNLADELMILPEQFSTPDDHRSLLQKIRPTILAVSSHSPHLDKKASLMQEIGGKVEIVHEHNPEISTTQLLEQKKNEHGKN